MDVCAGNSVTPSLSASSLAAINARRAAAAGASGEPVTMVDSSVGAGAGMLCLLTDLPDEFVVHVRVLVLFCR